jgi:hypothetical protein
MMAGNPVGDSFRSLVAWSRKSLYNYTGCRLNLELLNHVGKISWVEEI